MILNGLRVHIAGSADKNIDQNILRYTHGLITELVKRLIVEKAMFVTGIGKEPLSIEGDYNSPSIIFDWNILSTIYECWQQELICTSDFPERLIYTVGKTKTEEQIPDHRRDLWEFLQNGNFIEIAYLKPGRASGGAYRELQVSRGDILIAIGGGEGLEELADRYIDNGKQVIPLDLQIGSSCNDGTGGAYRLAIEMLSNPERFVHISDTGTVGSLVASLTTRKGKKPVKEVVQAIVKLILSLEPNHNPHRLQSFSHNGRKMDSIPQGNKPQGNNLPCAAIITAIPVEYMAVRAHLTNLQEITHPQGTIYEQGRFVTENQAWEVVIVEIGTGNSAAAMEGERAISHFKPHVILFVGVAGGIKDVALGDVVAATKVYSYESGKAKLAFEPRPDVGQCAYKLIQRARAESRKLDWQQRLVKSTSIPKPRVFVAPIAAGEKIVADTKSTTYEFLRSNYGDAVAVEMEGGGLLQAAHANSQVSLLIIRGISDLIDGKSNADASGFQEIAARNASAFAFEILAKFCIDSSSETSTDKNAQREPTWNQEVIYNINSHAKNYYLDNTPDVIQQLKKFDPQKIASSFNTSQEVHEFIFALSREANKMAHNQKFVEAVFILEFGIATCNIVDNIILQLSLEKELSFIKAKLP
jgi:nucleoside phosphorylase